MRDVQPAKEKTSPARALDNGTRGNAVVLLGPAMP